MDEFKFWDEMTEAERAEYAKRRPKEISEPDDWTERARWASYSEIAKECGFDDENGEPVEPK